MPTTIANSSKQRHLEKIHQDFLDQLAKENTLRAGRNEAARSAVAHGVSVTHLARAGGISRELLHRILRASPPARAGAGKATGKGQGAETLAAIQKSLDAAASKRAGIEKQRAVAIRGAVHDAGVTRTEIARWAGVSSETVRKVCLSH